MASAGSQCSLSAGGAASSGRSIFGPLPTDDWTYDGLALGVRAALDQLVVGLSRAACAFVNHKGWMHFGHARSDDHAREALGRSGRWLRDLAALGAAFERLPAIEAALAIARVASVDSIDAWLELARRVPVRTLKHHVRAAREAGSHWPVGPGSARPIEADSDGTGGTRPSVKSSKLRVGKCEPGQVDVSMGAKTGDSKPSNSRSGNKRSDSPHGQDTEDGIECNSNGGKDSEAAGEPDSNGDATKQMHSSTDTTSPADDICTATLQDPTGGSRAVR